MAEREQDPRITALYDAEKKVYSFSRLASVEQCLYGAWLTYIKHEKGSDNIYSALGGRVHDTLEMITHGKATEADLWPAVIDELEELNLQGIEFPKSKDGSDKIRERYIKNMDFFCRNYHKPKGEFKTEELLILDLGERALIGYADLIRYNKDGTVSLYDYKTSSMYRGADLDSHGFQLLIYKKSLEALGYTVRDIAWVFLKYSTIQYESTVGGKITKMIKNCENIKLYDTMWKIVQNRMKYVGYDQFDIDEYLDKFKTSGSMDVLPKEIRSQFKITPLVKKYEPTPEREVMCLDFIHNAADKFEALTENAAPEVTPINEKNSFFCMNLCGHSDKCPYAQAYREGLKFNVSDDELF